MEKNVVEHELCRNDNNAKCTNHAVDLCLVPPVSVTATASQTLYNLDKMQHKTFEIRVKM